MGSCRSGCWRCLRLRWRQQLWTDGGGADDCCRCPATATAAAATPLLLAVAGFCWLLQAVLPAAAEATVRSTRVAADIAEAAAGEASGSNILHADVLFDAFMQRVSHLQASTCIAGTSISNCHQQRGCW